MTAKFCVFCGSESDEAPAALNHQKLYLEYRQVAALLAMAIEIQEEVLTERDYLSKEDILEHFDYLVEERRKIIEDSEYRTERYDVMGMLFSLPVNIKK
jgi:hypothetical protein